MVEGVRDALIVWNGTLIDGHNRHAICKKHNLPFNTVEKSFDSEDNAKIWIINNQFGRRNLPSYARGVLALKLEELFSKKAKERMLKGKADPTPTLAQGETRESLAKASGISHGSIDKVKKIEAQATNEQKQKLMKGEDTINNVFKQLKREEVKKEFIAKNVELPTSYIYIG